MASELVTKEQHLNSNPFGKLISRYKNHYLMSLDMAFDPDSILLQKGCLGSF
jgi:hypothetical protein